MAKYENDLGKQIGKEIMDKAKEDYNNSFRDAITYYGMYKNDINK